MTIRQHILNRVHLMGISNAAVTALAGLFAGATLAIVAVLCISPHRAGTTAASADTVFCDRAHKVAFIDAMHCGGMSSCDRDSLLTAAGEHDMTTENICPKPR